MPGLRGAPFRSVGSASPTLIQQGGEVALNAICRGYAGLAAGNYRICFVQGSTAVSKTLVALQEILLPTVTTVGLLGETTPANLGTFNNGTAQARGDAAADDTDYVKLDFGAAYTGTLLVMLPFAATIPATRTLKIKTSANDSGYSTIETVQTNSTTGLYLVKHYAISSIRYVRLVLSGGDCVIGQSAGTPAFGKVFMSQRSPIFNAWINLGNNNMGVSFTIPDSPTAAQQRVLLTFAEDPPTVTPSTMVAATPTGAVIAR